MSAYDDLLDRLSNLTPRFGWGSALDIPELSDEDVAAVLAEADDLLADAMCDMTFNTVLAAQLKATGIIERRYALIGTALVHELEALARHYLLHDLRERAERFDEDVADERRHEEHSI